MGFGARDFAQGANAAKPKKMSLPSEIESFFFLERDENDLKKLDLF